ncbi:MAG: hypothetical protein ACI971_001780 [Colwellia sp.]|jgi:hypothetical protein
MKIIKTLTIAVLLTSISSHVFAGQVTPCGDKTGVDYSDAPDSYGAACHKTRKWQSLGPGTNKGSKGDKKNNSRHKYKSTEGYKNWSKEDNVNSGADGDVQNGIDSDDGVQWRTSSDSGVTWSNFGTDGVIFQGDVAQFKFLVGRSQTGTHEFDQVKAWGDWNANGFDGKFDDSEVLIDEKWALNENANDIATNAANNPSDSNRRTNNDLSKIYNTLNSTNIKIYNSVDLYREYIKDVEIPLNAMLGDTWLRARIVCENALDNAGDGVSFLATGYYDQGEVEDYQITIAAKVVTDVPEPSTLLVFALGFISIAAGRRKLKYS